MRKLLVMLCASLALGASLPAKGPIPLAKPVEQAPPSRDDPEAPAGAKEQEEPQEQQAIPAPVDKPIQNETLPAGQAPLPQEKPSPSDGESETQEEPEQKATPAPSPEDAIEKGEEPTAPPPPPPPIAAESAEDFAACTADLTRLGVRFRPLERIDDGDGCGIDKPIEIETLSADIDLKPRATLRCETALQLARMTRDMIGPAAALGLPDKGRLVAVHHGSAYVCRKRNGQSEGKLSEHARGNGIDIVSLEFEKATVPMAVVRQEDSDLASAFQRVLNAVACLYFSTVLSPGSDAAHQDHLHLDVLRRNNGYRYCR